MPHKRRWQSGRLHPAVTRVLRTRWFESITAHVKIVRVIQTCMACPSQWDAWDEEGNYYYLRFRHGCGEIRQYETPDWVDAPWKTDVDETEPGWGIRANTEYIRTIAEFELENDPLAGWITLEEFAERAGIELAGNLMTTNFGDHLRDELIMEGFINLIPEDEWGVKHDSDQDEEQHRPEKGTTD